jgi:hypothetical protein
MSNPITLAEISKNHALFCWTFLKVLDKDKSIVPFRLNSIQKHMLKHMTDRTIVLKMRQGGISTFMQSMIYRLSITQQIDGAVLAHDDRSTQAFRRMYTRFNEYMPEEFRPEFASNNRTLLSVKETGSNILVATAGGRGAVGRGFTMSHVHLSEYAFIIDPKPLLSGLLQAGNPSVVIESTANGTGNHFHELVMTAHETPEESIWKLLFYEWFKHELYQIPLLEDEELEYSSEEDYLIAKFGLSPAQIKWRRYKIKELGIKLFQQEYPESVEQAFLTSGTSYFADIKHLNEQFTAPYIEPHAQQYAIGGLDLGRANDFTVLSVIDKVTGNELELFRINNTTFDNIMNRVIELCDYWNLQTLWIEQNNIGAVVTERMIDKIEQHPSLNTQVRLFNMTRTSKPQVVNQMHAALNEQELNLLPDPTGRAELAAFTAKQTATGHWQFSAESGHDDTVIARVLAWNGVLMDDVRMLYVG